MKGSISEKLAHTEILRMADWTGDFLRQYIPASWHSKILSHIDADALELRLGYKMLFTTLQNTTVDLIAFVDPRVINQVTKNALSERGLKSKKPNLAMLDRIRTATVELRAILGEKKLSIQQICELRTGQILMLPTSKTGAIDVLVEDKVVFKAQVGVRNQHFVVKIIGKPRE
jgi:flagellar motor switch/type III secretory pathway protein FliN